MEASYVWRDLHQLENEAEQLKRSCEEKRREWESWVNEDKKRKKREEAAGYFAGWRIHPLEAVSMLGAFFVTFLLFHKPVPYILLAFSLGLHKTVRFQGFPDGFLHARFPVDIYSK